MKKLSEINTGFIGTGAMGSALIKAASKATDKIFITSRTKENRARVAKELGVTEAEDNISLTKLSDIVFLVVKPAQLDAVLHEIKPHCDGKILVSAAAGIKLSSIRAAIGGAKPAALIRVMPNIAASAGESMTALAVEKPASETEKTTIEEAAELVRKLLISGGLVERVDENLMDCVTAISGSGPAYAFIFIEALADAAVSLGMPRRAAYKFAAQTLKGASTLVLESGRHPAELKDAVCSPAGTSIEAVCALEAGAFRSTIIEAARNAARKSRSLAAGPAAAVPH
ncbi:MAG: pyrroline-5-carboxylate reductase [Spirochaetaceae bacterium]|nr:pyrroline-5-carboxylate reductase [Spirochaetaceae bacterium]